jgi:hypothetical protein
MSTTSIPGIAIEVKANDMVSVIVGLYDPDNDGAPDITLRGDPNLTVGAVQEKTTIPRFDLAIPIKWGNFYIQPVFSYLKKKFDYVDPMCEDEETIWLFGASGSVQFGPVTVSAEYVHGKNIGDANYSGPGSTSGTGTAAIYQDAAGYWKVGEITDNAWWAQIRWQATPQIAVQGAYGQWIGKGDHNPAVTTDDRHYKRSGWVANVWYAVGPNFFIVPSYSHLNLGSDINLEYDEAWGFSPSARWSWGTVDFYGVGFYMIF